MFFNSKVIFELLCFTTFFVGLIRGQSSYCPDPAETLPYCNCSTDTSNRVTLDCSLAKDENQLEEYFTQTVFPNLDVYRLYISKNQGLKYLTRNVFGQVTFQHIYLYRDAIVYINESVFVNSYSSLLTWLVNYCNLPNVGAFPFYSLNLYTKLSTLDLYNAGVFDVLPRISSNSLDSLYVANCELQYIPLGVFDDLPSLVYLYLHNNNIVSILPGSFSRNTLLSTIYLDSNNIGRIAEGTFQNLPNLQILLLYNNNIDLIESGAFSNLPRLSNLQLDNNQLQYLLIEGFGYFPALTRLEIYNNNIMLLENQLFTICCPVLKTLYADNNELTSISDGMFDGFNSGYIQLYSNQLKTLDEDWLKAPLTNSNKVDLNTNPLKCGCDMAWLYAETSLMTNLTATCSNGTDIKSLDSSWFSTNC